MAKWNRQYRRQRPYRKALDAKEEPYLAILDYRNTPTEGMDTSPAQRLMNRRTKTLLPTTQTLLQPRVVYPEREKKKIIQRQKQQAKYFDRTAKDLPELEGDTVRMKPFRMGQKTWRKATVTSRLDSRSYTVETPEGDTYRRNRCHLKKSSEKPTQQMSATGGNVCEDPESSVPDHTTMESQTSIPLTSLPDKQSPSPPTGEQSAPLQLPSQLIATPRPQRAKMPPAYLKDFVTE